MRRLRFEIAYDGTDFHGWQIQPGLPTVQGVLEEVIGAIEGAPVHVAASGRTDAGVHALAQVAAVSISNPIPTENFRRAVNRLLPPSIRIDHVAETALDFHPRFHAQRKTYEYRIYREEVCPPFVRRFVYHHPYPLDEPAMVEAAQLLEGEHDFTGFAASDDNDAGASKVRTIFCSSLARRQEMLVYRVTGSGFLKHMVRNILGVLIEVGKGNLSRSDVIARLDPSSHIPPGPTSPASGLFLVAVSYHDRDLGLRRP
ncbi:MAG: tRNA pseudouridine(38-40) synthase TruA [Acidobacteriaceae bacterium]|nr:tRNA pseudouridine(38-40) synthase TruA [Acidobacteriaceae bacterium]